MALAAQRTGSRRRPSAKTAASEAVTEAERIHAALCCRPSRSHPSERGGDHGKPRFASGRRTSVVRAWSYNEPTQTVVLGCYNKSGHSKRTATAITTQAEVVPGLRPPRKRRRPCTGPSRAAARRCSGI